MLVTRFGAREAVLAVLVADAVAGAFAACSSESSDPEGEAIQARWMTVRSQDVRDTPECRWSRSLSGLATQSAF
jgi:hypothetical protein